MSKYNTATIHDIAAKKGSHEIILNRVRKDSVVLEFGPAGGAMSRYMVEYLNCSVYAVELDVNCANELSSICKKVSIGDIESYLWVDQFKDLKFDYIIFADVLEHLYDTSKVLTIAKQFLHPSGRILMSIPNIAHDSIVMNLLQDKFKYNNLGILDNTHVRFFTKHSIDSIIANVGYKSTYISGTFIETHDTEFNNNYSEFNYGVITSLLKRPYGRVYQFIYELIDIEYSSEVETLDELCEKIDFKNKTKRFCRAYCFRLFNFIKNSMQQMKKFLW